MASDDDFRQQLAELSARIASLEAEVQDLRAAQPPVLRRQAATPTPPPKRTGNEAGGKLLRWRAGSGPSS